MVINPDSYLALVDTIAEKIPLPLPLRVMFSKTDAEFDSALEDILERAINYMERNADNLIRRDEDSITCDLVAFVQIPDVLYVTQQEHSKGHVDITIETRLGSFRRLGEAKIYDGPSYHVKGLEQLIGRYSTGRENSGLIFEYVKDRGIKDLVAKIRKFMDENKPCSQEGNSQEHRIQWAFTTEHKHTSGEVLHVLHLGCNFYKGT